MKAINTVHDGFDCPKQPTDVAAQVSTVCIYLKIIA
jgi:hypothetical protein